MYMSNTTAMLGNLSLICDKAHEDRGESGVGKMNTMECNLQWAMIVLMCFLVTKCYSHVHSTC